MEVPSTTTGMLAEIRVPAGEVAPVGAVVAVIADGSGARSAQAAGSAKPARPGASAAAARIGGSAWPAMAPHASLVTPPPAAKADRSARSVLRGAHARAQLRPGATARRHGGDAAGAPARRRSAASISRAYAAPAPHGRIVAQDVEAGAAARAPRAARGRGPERRPGQGALSRRAVRGGAARRHAPHHRDAADAGEADHPAFLSDGRRRDRRAGKLREEANAAAPEGQGRRARVQAFGQRPRHQGAGRRRCSGCRPPTRCGRRIASCASGRPTSASRSRSTAA